MGRKCEQALSNSHKKREGGDGDSAEELEREGPLLRRKIGVQAASYAFLAFKPQFFSYPAWREKNSLFLC